MRKRRGGVNSILLPSDPERAIETIGNGNHLHQSKENVEFHSNSLEFSKKSMNIYSRNQMTAILKSSSHHFLAPVQCDNRLQPFNKPLKLTELQLSTKLTHKFNCSWMPPAIVVHSSHSCFAWAHKMRRSSLIQYWNGTSTWKPIVLRKYLMHKFPNLISNSNYCFESETEAQTVLLGQKQCKYTKYTSIIQIKSHIVERKLNFGSTVWFDEC